MPGTFDQRMAELEAMTPKESVRATVEVDQVYAHYQHEGISYDHNPTTPSGTLQYRNGGGAKYLERPWLEAAEHDMKRWADGLLREHGLFDASTGIADEGVRMVDENAPVEFGDLRESGHATVAVDGVVRYDVPPRVPRLSEDELKAKGDLRRVFDGPVAR